MPNNEQQSIAVEGSPGGGSFTLAFTTPEPSASKATTVPIPFNADAATVQAALESLPNIGPGNVTVSGAAGGPYAVEFQGSRFADTNVDPITADANLTPSGTIVVKTVLEGAGTGEVCSAADVSAGYACSAGAEGASAGQSQTMASKFSAKMTSVCLWR